MENPKKLILSICRPELDENLNFRPFAIKKNWGRIWRWPDLFMPNRPNFVCLPAKNRFLNFKKSCFFGFFGDFWHIFSSKWYFEAKVAGKWPECIFSDSLHPKDHFYVFLSNFGQFKILKFLTFFRLLNGPKSNSVLGC